MTIEYRLAHETRGMLHDGELWHAVYRRNQDGSKELVARFHNQGYAALFADTMNDDADVLATL